MKTWLPTVLVAILLVSVTPEIQAGEIVKQTYRDAKGHEVSGWVYQSSRIWRYRRAARYPYFFNTGYVGYYGGYYPYWGTTAIVTPRFHTRTHFHSAPAIRSTARPAIRPALRATVRPVARPKITPTVRSKTTPNTRANLVPKVTRPARGTTTMRVYRSPRR